MVVSAKNCLKARSSYKLVQKTYLQCRSDMLLYAVPGDVAQLGERDNRTVEVRGSSPLISTARTIYFVPCKSQTSML